MKPPTSHQPAEAIFTPATDPPIAQRNVRRQFNLRTLFEATTGICVLTPALEYVQRESSRDTLVWTLLLFACGLSMLGACWLFVRRCPASKAGSLLAMLFCMSMFNGFLRGGFALFPEVDQTSAVGNPLLRFALMWIVGSVVSFLFACMIALGLLIPAMLSALVVRARLSHASRPVAGLLIGLLTGAMCALAWRIAFAAAWQVGPVFQMLLATAYGGYFGGRLMEQRRGTVSATAAELPYT